MNYFKFDEGDIVDIDGIEYLIVYLEGVNPFHGFHGLADVDLGKITHTAKDLNQLNIDIYNLKRGVI